MMPDSGYCETKLYNNGGAFRWFFNITTQGCLPFLYSGCGGNRNRFVTQDICERWCAPTILQSVQYPNLNSFNNIIPTSHPTSAVIGPAVPIANQRTNASILTPPSTIGRPPLCSMGKDAGFTCPNGVQSTLRFYWNYAKWDCLAFIHSGCGGNQNSFATKTECKQRCQPCKFFWRQVNHLPAAEIARCRILSGSSVDHRGSAMDPEPCGSTKTL